MNAMILAAGFGERLRPHTDRLPKPLFPLPGGTILENTLRYLARFGIKKVVVNVHHLAQDMTSFLESAKIPGLEVIVSREEKILGTAGGIKAVEGFLKGGGPFLVINSDVVTDLDLGTVFRFHRDRRSAATLVLREDPDQETYGTIRIAETGRVVSVPPHGSAGPDTEWRSYMFTGIQVFDPEIFSYLPSPVFSDTMRVLFPALIRDGKAVTGFVMEGDWNETGTGERYLETVRRILRGEIQTEFSASLSKNGVTRADLSFVDPSVRLSPPFYAGRGCRIGPGCQLGPETLIGDSAELGADCRVERSVILPGSSVPKGTRIESRIF